MGRCSPSGGRTYRGRAGECPRTFAGFVDPRSDIGQPNLRRGRRLVNGKVESTNGGKIDRGKASECSRTFVGFVGRRGGLRPRRANGLAKYIVRRWHKRFSTEKTIPPWNRSGKAEVISTASNFRMSAAPINSYPGIHAGAPLFRNYNGRSKEALELF